jgi:hypothetical protein
MWPTLDWYMLRMASTTTGDIRSCAQAQRVHGTHTQTHTQEGKRTGHEGRAQLLWTRHTNSGLHGQPCTGDVNMHGHPLLSTEAVTETL